MPVQCQGRTQTQAPDLFFFPPHGEQRLPTLRTHIWKGVDRLHTTVMWWGRDAKKGIGRYLQHWLLGTGRGLSGSSWNEY